MKKMANLFQKSKKWNRIFARETMADDLRRMEHVPGQYYNFHPGSHVGQGMEAGIAYIAEGLNAILRKDQSTTVLLETMAGKGSEVGGRFEELREILDRVELQGKMGVCLDTCHVSDGGYDIIHDLDGVLTEFDRIIGLKRLKAIHLNDSKKLLTEEQQRAFSDGFFDTQRKKKGKDGNFSAYANNGEDIDIAGFEVIASVSLPTNTNARISYSFASSSTDSYADASIAPKQSIKLGAMQKFFEGKLLVSAQYLWEPSIEGTGGIRKVRFPLESKGKSGSVRVCYTDFAEYEVTYLITAFTKKEQENLTNEERNVLKKLVKSLKEEAAKNRR